MKRLLVILILLPSLAFGAFTEFYCDPVNGSNLNAGSTTSASASYTSASGNWNGSNIFTVQDGTNPSLSVAVGDFVSVYANGSTETGFIARVSAVQNATNGTVTINSSFATSVPPSSGTGTRTLKNGGSWKGPNGTQAIPLSLTGLRNLQNTSSDPTRVNFKNSATYSITAQLSMGSNQTGVRAQGYSSTVGDGGKAIIDGGSNAIILLAGSQNCDFYDFVFSNNGTTGTNALTNFSSNAVVRCVFHDSRGPLTAGGGGISLYQECEFYNWNKANNSTVRGAVQTSIQTVLFDRCYFHDSAGASTALNITTNSLISYQNCIFDTLGGIGIELQSSGVVLISGCDFYNITGDAIKITAGATSAGSLIVENSNFIKGGAFGINVNSVVFNGLLLNNGFGTGTMANASGNTNGLKGVVESGSVSYASGVAPYVAPTTGNFSINLAAAINAGRGVFTQTDGTNSGTVGYPDIGAAQHNDTCGGTGPCQTSGASAQ